MICAVADTVGITVVESVSSTGCLASFLTAYSTVVGIMLVGTVVVAPTRSARNKKQICYDG